MTPVCYASGHLETRVKPIFGPYFPNLLSYYEGHYEIGPVVLKHSRFINHAALWPLGLQCSELFCVTVPRNIPIL